MRRFTHGACALSGYCLNDGWSFPGGGRHERSVFLGGCDDVDGVDTWVQNLTSVATPHIRGGTEWGSTLISMSSPCAGPRCDTRQCLTAVPTVVVE